MIGTMVSMQKDLNNNLCGDAWCTNNENIHGRPMYWSLYTVIEIVEAIMSMNIEHWKDREADYQNIITEYVDAFHFMLSDLLTYHGGNEQNVVMGVLEGYNNRKVIEGEVEVVKAQNELIVAILIKDYRNSYALFFTTLMNVLGDVNGDTALTILYQGYIAKNLLNGFRKKHGYKEGTYIKLWDGKREDNYFLREYLVMEPNASKDEILEWLERTYKKYTQGVE